MPYKLNPVTRKLDYYEENDGEFLSLDQTTPQTVTNGAPQFDGGIIIKRGQKIYFDG